MDRLLQLMRTHGKRRAVLAGGVVALCLAIHGQSASYGFVWDDHGLTLGTKAYRTFDLAGMLLRPGNGLEYLPVRDLTLAIDFLVWGANPAGFHISNIIVFCLLGIVVMLFAERLSTTLGVAAEARWVGVLAAVLYACHPLQVEPVSAIMLRNTLVSGLFFFSSCLMFLVAANRNTRWWPSLSVALLCAALAFLSKATTITLPLVIALLALTTSNKIRNLLFSVPFFFLAAGDFLIARRIAGSAAMTGDWSMSLGVQSMSGRIALALQLPFFYAEKFLLPVNLSVDYPEPFSRSFANPWPYLAIASYAAISGAAWKLRRKHAEVGVAFLWIGATLAPVSNLLVTAPVVADRYAFLCLFGFCFLVASAALGPWPRSIRRATTGLVLCTAVVYSSLAFERSSMWKSDATLWTRTVQESPHSWKALSGLAQHYLTAGDRERAFAVLEQLRRERPQLLSWEYFRAQELMGQGQYLQVIAMLETAFATVGDNVRTRLLLATAYERLGNYRKAASNLRSAIERREAGMIALQNDARRRHEALRATLHIELEPLRRAARESPSDPNARSELAKALYEAGLYDEAIREYEETERVGGPHWGVSYNIGNIYRLTRRFELARPRYEQSIALNPNHADSFNGLGLVLQRLGEHDLAERAYERAMSLAPQYGYPALNRAVLAFKLGDTSTARRRLEQVKENHPELVAAAESYLLMLDAAR